MHQVVHVYSMSHKDVMGLPLKAFWGYVNDIPRIEAYEAKMQMRIATLAHGSDGKGITSFFEAMDNQIGIVIESDQKPEIDMKPEPGAMDMLRRLA